MRISAYPKNSLLLALTLIVSAPALAWVPKLEETTAKNVIDGVYGRREPVTTFYTLDLTVKDGKFVAGDKVVSAVDGGEQCVSDWLAKPTDYAGGSRLSSVTLSGQADQLYFQAVEARDSFKNLTVKDALGADLTQKRFADGELRVDLGVSGLPTQEARRAYMVRLKGKDGKMIAPVRVSYVNDWKSLGANAAASGPWQGTLVYYFKPLEGGLGASDKTELLVRNEFAESKCAYSVPLDLGKFQ